MNVQVLFPSRIKTTPTIGSTSSRHSSNRKDPTLKEEEKTIISLQIHLNYKDEKLKHGLLTELAQEYGVSRWTMQRLWKVVHQSILDGHAPTLKPKFKGSDISLGLDLEKIYKEEHPNSKGVNEVANEAGDKWKSMADEEEKQYVVSDAELKAECEKATEKSNAQKEDEIMTEDRELTEVKDPYMPKRPPTAYSLFRCREDIWKTYEEEHPDSKGIHVVAKEAGAKWKSMTDEVKKQYVVRAAELKAEYEKSMKEYYNQKEDEEKKKYVVRAAERKAEYEKAIEEYNAQKGGCS